MGNDEHSEFDRRVLALLQDEDTDGQRFIQEGLMLDVEADGCMAVSYYGKRIPKEGARWSYSMDQIVEWIKTYMEGK